MDDLKSFTYVLAVAECKSISKAAELFYIFHNHHSADLYPVWNRNLEFYFSSGNRMESV